MKTSSRRRSFASLIAAAAVLAGLFVAPTQPASALGCVLGPSLASAAKAAGVSCPDVEGGGGGSAAWGATGGACNFGWGRGRIPDGMLDFLNGGYYFSTDSTLDSGERVSRTYYMRGGRTIGQVEIWSYRGRFVMGINVYGRAGLKQEVAYFDCMESSSGAMYEATPNKNLIPMPGTGSVGVPAEVTGLVQTRGTMSALPDNKYLLRIDVTNTGTTSNYADVFLGLKGYSVESIPLLARGVDCEPYEGLFCVIDSVLPGQTISTIFVLSASGDPVDTETIDVEVSARGLRDIKSSVSHPAIKHPMLVSDSYVITRP